MLFSGRKWRFGFLLAVFSILALVAVSCGESDSDGEAMTEIAALKAELTTVKADLNAAETDIGAAKAEAESAKAEAESAKAAAAVASTAAEGNVDALEAARQRLADAEEAAAAAQADAQAAQAEAQTARDRADEAQKALEMQMAQMAEAEPAESVTLEFWSWNNEGAYPVVHEEAEERFEAENPNVDVVRVYTPFADYMTNLRTAMAAGEPPDIAQVPWTGEYTDLVRNGQLASLAREFEVGFPDFFGPIASIASVDGIPYAIPLDVNSLQIAYNKDIFAELGLEVPRSKDELIAVAAALSAADYFGVAVGTNDRWAGGDLFFNQLAYTDPTNSLIVQADAGEAPWDSPEFLGAAENLAELIDAGVFAPGSNSMVSFVEALELFVSEEAAMFFPVGNFITGGIAAQVEDSFEWGLFPFPSPTGGESYAVGGVAEMFSVPSDAANDDLAVEFLRYLTDAEGEAALVSNDFIPSWIIQLPSDVSDLYRDLIAAQATVRNRTVYTTPVYAEILNGVQGLLDQSTTPEEMIAKMVEAAP